MFKCTEPIELPPFATGYHVGEAHWVGLPELFKPILAFISWQPLCVSCICVVPSARDACRTFCPSCNCLHPRISLQMFALPACLNWSCTLWPRSCGVPSWGLVLWFVLTALLNSRQRASPSLWLHTCYFLRPERGAGTGWGIGSISKQESCKISSVSNLRSLSLS